MDCRDYFLTTHFCGSHLVKRGVARIDAKTTLSGPAYLLGRGVAGNALLIHGVFVLACRTLMNWIVGSRLVAGLQETWCNGRFQWEVSRNL
jgi:hypothetical protein